MVRRFALGLVVGGLAAALVRWLLRGDQDRARLMAAPVDDEPLTKDEEERLRRSLEQVRRGELVDLDEAFPLAK